MPERGCRLEEADPSFEGLVNFGLPVFRGEAAVNRSVLHVAGRV